MDDPRRLIDDPGSELGRSLIASAQADVPAPARRARTAKRLGIVAGLAAGTGAGSEVSAVAAGWKLATVLLALGGAVGIAIWRSPSREPVPPPEMWGTIAPVRHGEPTQPRPPDPTPPVAEIAPSVVAPVAAPAPRPSHPSPAVRAGPARAAAPRSQPAPAVTAPSAPPPSATDDAATGEPSAEPGAEASDRSEPAPPPVAAPALPSRLAAEVAVVDRARDRLSHGDYLAAHTAVAEYRQRFTGGDLDAETDAVEIEIAIAERDHPRARTLATAFLARFPRSPLGQRVHSLLDRLPK